MMSLLNDLLTLVGIGLIGALPILFFGSIWLAVRHGPVATRFWRGERWHGFAAFVALVCFLTGFIGPMILAPGANQGPLLGLLFTGPLGAVIGVAWGLTRAAGRVKSSGSRPRHRPR